MFANVEWSGPRTLTGTVQACRHCGLTVETGEPWFDIDEPSDLFRASMTGYPIPNLR